MTVVDDILQALGLAQPAVTGPRDFLRFFLSAADQARVVPGSLKIDEGVLGAGNAMTVSFTVVDPAGGAPQLRPLFPGSVTFVADPAAPGTQPVPSAITLTPAGFANWRTRGALRVSVTDAWTEQALQAHSSTLEVQPNVAFYSPVQLSEAFMLTTLITKLKKDPVTTPTPAVKPSNANWPKHAVSRFLWGQYQPVLRLGAKPADDDVIAHDMPTVVMASDGKVTLTIAIARAQSPQDGGDADLDALAPRVDRSGADHPRNAPIPARHVYRVLRPHLIDAAVGTAVPDTTLAAWPAARRYFPFQVTRTWQQIPNFSVLFPARGATVSTGPATSISLKVPAHGVVYVPQDPGVGTPPAVPTLSLTGFTGQPTTFLAGSTPMAWSVKSGTTAVPLATGSVTHVILRRPMAEEILADQNFPEPGGSRCTYMSLRRASRAFVDHRITGGRLVNEGAKTTQATRDLLTNAWPDDPAASAKVRKALGLAPRMLLNNNPLPAAPPGRARDLEHIWIACFPQDVPAVDVDGNGVLTRTQIFSGGQMFYALWQTIEGVLKGPGTKRNFSNEHVGTGSAGAIVSLGLATGFLTRPDHVAPHPNAADLTANVHDMLTLLTPATALQFWNEAADYRVERSRRGDIGSYGHSPIFRRYMANNAGGTPTGIVVIDQFGGASDCPVSGGRITWGGAQQAVWIAAQWND